MGKEEGSLALTEITLSSEYELESKVSMSFSLLPLYISSPSTLSPPLLSPSPVSSPSLYNMSQYSSINFKQIIQQQQKQLAALQT